MEENVFGGGGILPNRGRSLNIGCRAISVCVPVCHYVFPKPETPSTPFFTQEAANLSSCPGLGETRIFFLRKENMLEFESSL